MARSDSYDLKAWKGMARRAAYDVNLLSKKMNVSRRQLQRYTQQMFQRSPQNWLDEERLNSAPYLLRRTRMVKITAFRLGFKQVSHFSRKFKLHYGITPTLFLARGGNSGAAMPKIRAKQSPPSEAGLMATADNKWPSQITLGDCNREE